ncbi:MAG TPA: amino acid racemase [Puia sp.]
MFHKKKLGIVGGMGSRAGAFFLQKIIDFSPADTDQDFLDIIFHNNSSIPDRTKAIVYNEPSPLPDILKSVELFNRNEVEVIALACVTSYFYYNQIAAHTTARVLNPLHLIADCIREEYGQVRRVGLLATTGTINCGLFHQELKKCNVEVVTLKPPYQEEVFMRAVYMKNGFKSSTICQLARDLMNESINKLKVLDVDLVIGGCTEVSIGVDPRTVTIPYIDVVDFLAHKTVDYCYNHNIKRSKIYING